MKQIRNAALGAAEGRPMATQAVKSSNLPNTINTLWFGDRLGYLERLSIASFLATGHKVNLFSYEPSILQGVPDGIYVSDAREIMDDPERVKLFDGKLKALGSDFFRYEVFGKAAGYWVDLDVILLKPLNFSDDYVFGWENDGVSINGAILRLPKGEILDSLRFIPEKNWCPPFFGPRRRAAYYIKRLSGDVNLEDLPWGVAGPAMITYLARKYGRLSSAQAREVFYPVPYERAEALYDDASVVEAMITPETVAIHMWHSRLRDLATGEPPAGSFIAKMCETFQVKTA
jgi:hypothetical protein